MLVTLKYFHVLIVIICILISNYQKFVAGNDNATSNSKPHIILIIADDMGWNDVSFHGSNEIPTPNIDALAYNGVILNRHYVLPSCTPSRTSLMTSRYPIREGLQGKPIAPGEPRGLRLNVTLMPEYLRQLGYETKLVGKWHLGHETEKHTPSRRGFNTFFGYYNGLITYFNKTIYADLNNGTFINGYDLHRDGADGIHVEFNNSEYFTDLITTQVEEIIKNNGNEKPLFLEIAHLAVHASNSKVETLEVRNKMENDKTFYYIKDSKRRKYAGMMKAMDDSVGRVIKALSDAKMLQNSIILFMADNGAPTTGPSPFLTPGSNYPLRGVKSTLFEGGVRGAACIFSPLIKNHSRLSEELMHVTDWLPTLYSAAGGKISNLGKIDGVDQWESLVKDSPSPRKNLLVNIDEIQGLEAAILGKHKLIKGAGSEGGGYYGSSGQSVLFPIYNTKKALASAAGRAIGKLSNFQSISLYKAGKLRKKSVVKCQKPSVYPKCATQCLFDIFEDPCETQDLSKSKPDILKSLRSYIEKYRKDVVPQQTGDFDSCSQPKYFHGVWMPWRRDDANLSTIVPESECRVD